MQEEFSEIMNRLSENARFALQKGDFYSKRYNKGFMGTEHLLMGILSIDTSTGAKMIREQGATLEEVEKTIDKPAVDVPGSDMAMMSLSEAIILTLRMARNFTKEQGLSVIGTEHILYALLSQPNSRAALILEGLNVDIDKVLDDIEKLVEKQTADEKVKKEKAKYLRKAPLKFLGRYGKDLTEEARAGKLDTVIGRENEIERVVTVLSRRTKSNPVLIGEAGVGKTAIVEGLATKIVKNEVPGSLIGKHIYQVDLSSVVAGTKFRGEFEERLKKAMDEVVKAGDVIIFIDEIHTIIGAGAAEGAIDAANILKPALARGELQVIGATTLDEYRKHIEKDAALERRFQPVTVGEPSEEEAILILKGIRDKYEAHHKITITDEAIETAVKLSIRYIPDRFLPDKAIDLIDEAASAVRMKLLTAPPSLKDLEDKIASIEKEKEAAISVQDFERAASLRDDENKLKKQLDEEKTSWSKESGEKKLSIGSEEIAEKISAWTHIPVQKLTEGDSERLKNLESVMHKRVVGQDEAVSAVARAIRRGRVGLKDPKRPIGSFIFLGPTGVGKTELSKTLAEAMFGDEDAIIRIDMSEYMESHSTSKLIGSPPGYVGYDDAGQLTEKVKRHPYSIILFDEIEKAHPDVFNILLQILDDGILTDSQGRRVDFRNTVIIMTSNIGARLITDTKTFGFGVSEGDDDNYENIKNKVLGELKKAFRPEFLNRVDETIVFHQLNKENIENIANIMLKSMVKRLEVSGIYAEYTNELVKYIADEGFDSVYGARPLKRAIQSKVEDRLAEEMLNNAVTEGDKILIDIKDGKLTVEKI